MFSSKFAELIDVYFIIFIICIAWFLYNALKDSDYERSELYFFKVNICYNIAPKLRKITWINFSYFLYSLIANKILASFWTFWLGNVYVNTVNNNEEFENIQKKWCGPRLVLTWLQHNVALKIPKKIRSFSVCMKMNFHVNKYTHTVTSVFNL